jgi:hypothetical protein
MTQTTDLWDVVAVGINSGAHRVIAAGKTEEDADAIVKLAVMRRGVEEEFFKAVPHGDNSGIEYMA